MPDGRSISSCFGPYLRYAIDFRLRQLRTDLENFGKKFRSFDEDHFRLLLLVELKGAEVVSAFEKEMEEGDEFGTEFGPDVGETRYVTMRCRKAAVTDRQRHSAFGDSMSPESSCRFPWCRRREGSVSGRLFSWIAR